MNNVCTVLVLVFCTTQIFSNEAAELTTENCTAIKTLPYTEQQFQDYVKQLSNYYMSINDAWDKTKDMIQNLIGDNQLPIADIFNSARKIIKTKTALLSEDIAENCTQETEDKFIILYSQVSQSLLTCASSKARKPLIALLKAQDDLQDALKRTAAIQDKFESCGNKTATEQEECKQPLILAAQMEETAGEGLCSQTNAALTAAHGVPPGLTLCTEHILKYVRGKMPSIVEIVDSCARAQ